MFGRRKQSVAVPEVGGEAPKFQLPSAQGGQLQLSMRTVRGPVVVAFYRPWSEEDIEFFKSLASKEDEINMAGGSVVGIGVTEAGDAREFVRASGIKSMVLYDYAKVTSRQWGLLERNEDHGDYSRPAVFVVDGDHKIAHAWVEDRPSAEEILAAVSAITGLPKPPEQDAEEKPKKAGKPAEGGSGETTGGDAGEQEKPKKLSAEERERIKAERRAAREAGKSLKTPQQPRQAPPDDADAASEKPAASAKASGSSETGEKPEPGEARVEAEVDASARDDPGTEEADSPETPGTREREDSEEKE